MAAISNMQLKWPNPMDVSPVGEISLDALPTAAAVVDSEGDILALNSDWRIAHPTSTPGSSAVEWCSRELREALLGGIRRAIGGENPRSVQDYEAADLPRRIT